MNNLSPLAFYPSRSLQPHRNQYAQNPTSLFVAHDLPPICVDAVDGDIPTTATIYDKDDNYIASFVPSGLIQHDIVVEDVTIPSWLAQSGTNGVLGYTSLANGTYYLRLGDLYSGLFTIGDRLANWTQVDWQFYDDIITADGKAISKNVKYRLLFNTDGTMVAKPEYQHEEDVNTFNGITYPVSQLSTKKYKFQVIGDESLADVMRLIRMADDIKVTSCINGIVTVLPTNTFIATPKWQGDDSCSIECEFDAFAITKVVHKTSTAPLYVAGNGRHYTHDELVEMIDDGYIPIASATELAYITDGNSHTMGAGTAYEDTYTCLDTANYVIVKALDKLTTWNTISNIKGVLDGNNYAIEGANIVTTHTTLGKYVGSFVKSLNGTIKNLSFISCKCQNTGYVAIVTNNNFGTIDNVHCVHCTVGNATDTDLQSGIITGFNDGTIQYSSADEDCLAINAGGFVSYNNGDASIRYCYSRAKIRNVTVANPAFGICHRNFGTIINTFAQCDIVSASGQVACGLCYNNDSTGSMTGSMTNCFDVSALTSDVNCSAVFFNSGTLTHVFYNSDLIPDSYQGVGKTTYQMLTEVIGINASMWYPFNKDEWTKNGNSYPVLKKNR